MSVELRPRRLVLVCRVVAAVVVVVFGVLAVLLPRGSSEGQQFGAADQVAFFAIGLLLAAAVLLLTRARRSRLRKVSNPARGILATARSD